MFDRAQTASRLPFEHFPTPPTHMLLALALKTRKEGSQFLAFRIPPLKYHVTTPNCGMRAFKVSHWIWFKLSVWSELIRLWKWNEKPPYYGDEIFKNKKYENLWAHFSFVMPARAHSSRVVLINGYTCLSIEHWAHFPWGFCSFQTIQFEATDASTTKDINTNISVTFVLAPVLKSCIQDKNILSKICWRYIHSRCIIVSRSEIKPPEITVGDNLTWGKTSSNVTKYLILSGIL